MERKLSKKSVATSPAERVPKRLATLRSDEAQMRIADERLRTSTERFAAGEELRRFTDLMELIQSDYPSLTDGEHGDVALPFLVMVDTRIQ
jgi:hypothetical protein